MMRTSWRPGPFRCPGPAVGSVTEFTAHRFGDLPGIVAAGLRLRSAWPVMEGAIGLWLWAIPTGRRFGSVSAWRSVDDLEAFVALPAHVAIMRRYHRRGNTRSAMWHTPILDLGSLWRQASYFLRGNLESAR